MSALEPLKIYQLAHYVDKLTYLAQSEGITYSYLTPYCCCCNQSATYTYYLGNHSAYTLDCCCNKASKYYDRPLYIAVALGFVCLIP